MHQPTANVENLPTTTWNPLSPPAREEDLLHAYFEQQVDLTPDAPALISPRRSFSYKELEESANQLAHYLRAQGAAPGKFVGIFFERSALPITAILATLKTGATYVPIDPSFPSERASHIVSDTNLTLLLTEASLAPRAKEFFPRPALVLDLLGLELANFPKQRLSPSETGASPSDIAYLIYTSGTTGRPKGVMAEHRHAYRYTRSFNLVCGTGPKDRVYQGFSLGFDGSIEEIWMAYSNGSTLVVPDRDSPKFGNELGQFLNSLGVTYLSTVPTLLSTISEAIPSLRTLVLSGEICPAELVNRWAKNGLRMLNVYGPTEATVNTTAAECVPGKPVTIGKPLPGYEVQILDENFKPVPHGQSGELYVLGPTLSRGYLLRPDLTAEKFLTLPVFEGRKNVRVYRTGDLARWNAEGEIEFHGRIDSQIKIRGFRVELAEIESLLLEQSNVRTSAVKMVERDGLQELAAYVTLHDGASELDRNALLSRLELRLPPYMVPGYLDVLSDLPLLASGKTDRSKLPAPAAPLVRQRAKTEAPATKTEVKIAAAWKEVLGIPSLSVEDNFFRDLGGHSLLAARVVTALRDEGFSQLTIRELYAEPSVRKLSAYLDSAAKDSAVPEEGVRARTAKQTFYEKSHATYSTVAVLQAISALLIYGLALAPLSLALLAEINWAEGNLSGAGFALSIVLLALGTWPAFLLLNVAAKWLLVGRYQPGQIPLWTMRYFRWWLAARFQSLARIDLLAGTPLLSHYARWMGAKIGRRCILNTAQLSTWDLLDIGNDSSVGAETQLLGYKIEEGYLKFGEIKIGKSCFVGIHSSLDINSSMGDHSALDDQSYLAEGTAIPPHGCFKGSPAQQLEVPLPELPSPRIAPRRKIWGALHLACIFMLEGILLAPAFSLLLLGQWIISTNAMGPLSPVLPFAMVPVGFTFYALYVVALKRAILNSCPTGVYSVESYLYLRKWCSDRVLRTARPFMLPLYTTLFLPHWLRLLGAKVGKRAEVSVLGYFAPEHMELGEESFFADGSIIGGIRFFRGHAQFELSKVGRRSFVGNSAILPVGATLGNQCLLGVTSAPPSRYTPDGTDWVGSPAFLLPIRQKQGDFDSSLTYAPSWNLYAHRAVIDGLRILIPSYAVLSAICLLFAATTAILHRWGMAGLLLAQPLLGAAMGAFFISVTLLVKKVFIGKFHPVIKPLWSPYVWKNEMFNGVYESLMAPVLGPLIGTPFLSSALRLVGCKIGSFCYLESTLFSEFDLVRIGSFVSLNRGAIVQNHLFEDRVMKSSFVNIENECTVGSMAVVLYDTEMQRGSNLGPLSLLMKGESLNPRTYWHGIPTTQKARPAAAAKAGERKLAFVRESSS